MHADRLVLPAHPETGFCFQRTFIGTGTNTCGQAYSPRPARRRQQRPGRFFGCTRRELPRRRPQLTEAISCFFSRGGNACRDACKTPPTPSAKCVTQSASPPSPPAKPPLLPLCLQISLRRIPTKPLVYKFLPAPAQPLYAPVPPPSRLLRRQTQRRQQVIAVHRRDVFDAQPRGPAGTRQNCCSPKLTRVHRRDHR